MTDLTPNLSLPYIIAAQAQKHVTHNDSLRRLDAIVQISVIDRDLAAPPASPANGARYIAAASASGAWAGQDGKIAAYQDGAWTIITPAEGWLAWVADEDVLLAYTGTAWVTAGGGSVNPAPLVGVNATADTTNRLSVSSPAALFNHSGNGHQLKINKATAADTASMLFQTGFSGRAEFGLTGDDNCHFKVSPDGTTWFEAILVNKSTGAVSFPNTAGGGSGGRVLLMAARTYYVRTDGNDDNSGLANTASGAFLTIQKAIDTVASLDLGIYGVTIQIAPGTYTGGNKLKKLSGAGLVTIRGDVTTPANVVVTSTAGGGNEGALFYSDGVSGYRIEGLKLVTSGGFAPAVCVVGGGKVTVGANDYGACTGVQLIATEYGAIVIDASYAISGGATAHFQSVAGQIIRKTGVVVTVTLTGTPAFSAYFAGSLRGGTCLLNGMSFSGSATGTRYLVEYNAVLFTNGGGANFFPGSVAGSTTTGGQYS